MRCDAGEDETVARWLAHDLRIWSDLVSILFFFLWPSNYPKAASITNLVAFLSGVQSVS